MGIPGKCNLIKLRLHLNFGWQKIHIPVLFKLGFIDFWKHTVWHINVGDILEEMKGGGRQKREVWKRGNLQCKAPSLQCKALLPGGYLYQRHARPQWSSLTADPLAQHPCPTSAPPCCSALQVRICSQKELAMVWRTERCFPDLFVGKVWLHLRLSPADRARIELLKLIST